MTLSALERAVASLGFEKSVDRIDETAMDSFYHAVSDAVSFVNNIRPVTDGLLLSVTDDGATIDGEEAEPRRVMQFDVYCNMKNNIRRLLPPETDGSIGVSFLDSKHYRIVNQNELWLDKNFRGDFYIPYEVEMPTYNANSDKNKEIPLDSDLCFLLPTLVAYYVLLDDQPEKAMEYKRAFGEKYQIAMAEAHRTHTVPFKSTNNW